MIPERQKGHVYYRCQVTNCPSNCVREERIEDAVYLTLRRVRMSDDQKTWLENEIEQWLQRRTPEIDVKGVALQFSQLKAKMERLTDALIDRLIDQNTFNSRKQAVLFEQSKLEDNQRNFDKNRPQPKQTRKFLELIKNLAEHYISAVPTRKRQIVDMATSNRKVADKNVYLEPANWLIATEQLLDVFSCAQSRPTSRRRTELRDQQLTEFMKCVCSDEMKEAIEVIDECLK